MRVQFIVARYGGATPQADVAELERGIADIVRTWEDRLADAIRAREAIAPEALLAKYGAAFSAGYAETFPAERALQDIERIERLGPDQPVVIDFHGEPGAPAQPHSRRRLFARGADRLSERVPVLENLGFSAIDERSYHIRPRFADGARDVTLHDMVLETSDGAGIDLERHDKRLEGCFLAVLRGDADNDGFNRLIVSAGADWREAATLRAYAAYLRQLGSPFGLRYLTDTLTRHAGIARDFLELFHLRFDPGRKIGVAERAGGRRRRCGSASRARSPACRAWTRTASCARSSTWSTPPCAPTSTRRTRSGGCRPTLAFKLDSKAVEAAPQPRPFREIWVYSPRVEGVHLRFGPIARGGIRWSDRAQDFRTEVLGLVRAQLVKNAVIVPSGAKGGFLPKQMPRSRRPRGHPEAKASPPTASSSPALLDITDNIKDGKVVPPRQRGAPRRRRSLSGGRRRQGHRHLLRHRQRDLRRARLLARRCLRLGRLGRLRPQEDGRSPRAAPGSASSATSARWTSTSSASRSAWWASATCRATCSATACCCREHIQLVAAFDHRDIFIDPNPGAGAPAPSASGCSICRARAGRTTTRPRSPGAAACSRAAPSRSR